MIQIMAYFSDFSQLKTTLMDCTASTVLSFYTQATKFNSCDRIRFYFAFVFYHILKFIYTDSTATIFAMECFRCQLENFIDCKFLQIIILFFLFLDSHKY